MHRVGRVAAALLAASALASAAAAPAGASVSDAPSVKAAQARVDAARTEADAAGRAYLGAVAELGRLEERIAALTERIPRIERRIESLRALMRERAAELYREGGGRAGLRVVGEVVSTGDLIEGGRIAKLAEAAQRDVDDAADELAAREAALRRDRDELAAARERQEALVAEADRRAKELQEALARATEELRTVEQEESLRRYFAMVAAQQAAARAAEDAAKERTAPPPPPPRQQKPPAAPDLAAKIPVDSLVCPIAGVVTFSDDWGQPRSNWRVHQGTDVFAAAGTPNVAVADGIARQRVGGLAGNAIWLHTADGNAYFYAHLSRFEGSFAPDGTRPVRQGEVVGYTGNTGNAAGGPVHTHFEVHPQQVGPVNPYPLLRVMCAVEGGFEPPPPPPPPPTPPGPAP